MGAPRRVWRNPTSLLILAAVLAIGSVVGGVLEAVIAHSVAGFVVLLGAGVFLGLLILRPMLAADGDTLTIRGPLRSRTLPRAQILKISSLASNNGVRIHYRDGTGREWVTSSSAAEGVLNGLGAWIMRRPLRSKRIADELNAWLAEPAGPHA